MRVRVTIPPTVEPVTLEQLKLHCRVDYNTDDALISSLITAAREHCESVQNRAYITRTLEITMDRFPSKYFEIPSSPLQSVTSITYIDADDNTETVDADSYVVDAESYVGRIAIRSGHTWPQVTLRKIGGVKVLYIAGYGDAASDVPQTVKQAILLLVAEWYLNREASSLTGKAGAEKFDREIPFGVTRLLSTDRVMPV